MSDISKIKLPNGDIYNLKDSEALHQGDATSGAIEGVTKQGSPIVTITDAANNYPLQSLKVSFEPYQEGSGDPSPENIRPISGWDGVTVWRTGKNLFDVDAVIRKDGYLINDAGEEQTTVQSGYTLSKTSVQPGVTYTFSGTIVKGTESCRLYFYKGNAFINRTAAINNSSIPYTFVVPQNCDGIAIQYYLTTVDFSTIQLESGSTATAYVPYTGTSYPVTWQSAGTVYGGYVDLVRGVLVATHECITSAWGSFENKSVIGDNTRGRINTIHNAGIGGGTNSICNVAKRFWNYTDDTTHFYVDGMYAYLFLPNNTDENLEIQITYQLSAPITYTLTPTEIRTFSGVNNFWSNIGTISSITYAKDTKAFIQDYSVKDVQINGTSIVSQGVANISKASSTNFGVVKASVFGIDDYIDGGIFSVNDKLMVVGSNVYKIKSGADLTAPVSAGNQHLATFYGLAKASGDTTQRISDNAIGTYTDAAKAAIQHMIGTDAAIAPYEADVTADRSYAIGDTFMMNGKLYKATAAIAQNGVITPGSNCVETNVDESYIKDVQIEGTSIKNNGIASIPKMSETVAGVVKRGSGLYINSSGQLCSNIGTATTIKQGTAPAAIAPISLQGNTVFYGLAKAAGDTTQSNSSNAVGTYTTEAKSAIQTMLNVPDASEVVNDVQINSTSIINNGVANIPLASTTNIGVMKIGDTMSVSASGFLNFKAVGASEVKGGTSYARALTPERQHASVFYGLAKAAGADMSSSSNAIGTYTNEAKAAIKSMLGVVDGSTGTVEVSGTTPTITAIENTRYVCSEVSTLSITPPSSGICIVRFTSGTTATVLTVPNTVIWPEWFDATALESSRVYEICITDGKYGAVMSWPL